MLNLSTAPVAMLFTETWKAMGELRASHMPSLSANDFRSLSELKNYLEEHSKINSGQTSGR